MTKLREAKWKNLLFENGISPSECLDPSEFQYLDYLKINMITPVYTLKKVTGN